MQVQGIDVSKWQSEVNWQKAKTAGAQFAFIRAGSVDNPTGACYEDFQFQRNAQLAPPVLPVGFYWYFRPNQNAVKQAEFFINLIRGKDYKLYPTVDVEENGNLSASSVAIAIWSFLNRVYQQLGVKCQVYTSPGFWNSYVEHNTWAKEYPLWVAHWNVQVPMLPADWANASLPYTFWQSYVGNDGPEFGMGSKGLDHDVYNGDLEKFRREFHLDDVTPPPPETMSVDDFVIQKVYPAMVEHWGYQGPKPVK